LRRRKIKKKIQNKKWWAGCWGDLKMKFNVKKNSIIFILLSSFSYHAVVESALKKSEAKEIIPFTKSELKEISTFPFELSESDQEVYDLGDDEIDHDDVSLQKRRVALQEALKMGFKTITPVLFTQPNSLAAIILASKICALDPDSPDYYAAERILFEKILSRIASFLRAFYAAHDAAVVEVQSKQIKEILIPFINARLQQQQTWVPGIVKLKRMRATANQYLAEK
jgi:hypothetical protein